MESLKETSHGISGMLLEILDDKSDGVLFVASDDSSDDASNDASVGVLDGKLDDYRVVYLMEDWKRYCMGYRLYQFIFLRSEMSSMHFLYSLLNV